jgi:purine-binding chemotaxis protein CheW
MQPNLPQTGSESSQMEIIAFRLQGQEFCVLTTSIREIRGWTPCTPVPHSPHEMLGIISLRGTVIPIIDLSLKLGMGSTVPNQRSAIVVAEIQTLVVGLLVDEVSDILSVASDQIQPVPEVAVSFDRSYSEGIITHDKSMMCFLNLGRMFRIGEAEILAA